MTRIQIIEAFRAENPDLTERVISNSVLNDWCLVGDKYICAMTRCIVDDGTVFDSVASTSVYATKYDLTTYIPKFQDIDEYPGGGVSFDDVRLDKTTVAELDGQYSSWRERSAATPKKYYRRGKYLYFDYPVLTANLDIRVYSILISDDFNDDNITPFNQLTYLVPWHYILVKYLQWRAKQKIGKQPESSQAFGELAEEVAQMKKNISGGKYSPIYYQPRT